MKIIRLKILFFAIFAGMFFAAPAFCEHSPGGGPYQMCEGPDGGPDGGPGGGPGWGKGEGGHREKLRRRAEAMMILLLADEMNLPQEKEDKVVDILRAHFRERDELFAKERQYHEDIEKSLKNSEKDEALKKKLDEIDAVREKQQAAESRLKEKLKSILTVGEQAKFVVSWPKAQSEVMEQIEEHRNMIKKKNKNEGEEKGAPAPGDQKPPKLKAPVKGKG